MWTYRRMLRIPWTERVTNLEVLRITEKVQKRKVQYLGHVMRGQRYEILQLIIQGKMVGRRSVGKRRIYWLRNLREWFGVTPSKLFQADDSQPPTWR